MQALKQKAHNALRRSEGFFKTDMVYLAKGGFWLTLTQFVGTLSALILSIAFAHLFSKDAYGTYKYILALSGIIGTFTLTGLGSAVTQSVARGFDSSLKKAFKTMLKWSTLITVAALSGSIYYYFNDNLLLSASLIIIGIASPIIDATSLFVSYLSGKKEFKTLSVLNMIGILFPNICLVISLFFTKNVLMIVLVYFASYVLVLSLSYLYTITRFRPQSQDDPEIVSYAKHLTLLGILNAVADQIDKVLVFHYVGAVELAVYSFAVALPLQIKGTLKGIAVLAFPKFAERPIEGIMKDIKQKMLRLLFITVCIVTVYILVSPYLYKLLFPQYLESVIYSQVFSLSLLGFISSFPSTVLQAKKYIKGLYWANMLVAITKIVLLFVFVYMWGVWGVVIARITYEYIATAIVWIILSAVTKNEKMSPVV
ncbi:MAG: O-antigen export protein [Parcubacteria bacterium C7867-005]|nr:MAG: O-antigen export protein [Parcubacteria bacterium C7867-005]